MGHRTAVALGIIVPVVGAASWVAASEDPSAPIHVCVHRENGQVRIVSAGEQCRRQESGLQWNAEGPAGPTGPAGPAGAPGISGWEQRTAFAMVPAGGTGSAVVRCTSGKQVLSGGFATPGAGTTIVESHPATVAPGQNPGWVVWARNSAAADTALTVYALCATAT